MKIDFNELPAAPLEQRAALLKMALPEIIDTSVSYTIEKYHQSSLLELCNTFVDCDLIDAPSGEATKLLKVGFFPWSEAFREFDSARSLALQASYKASIDHLRRALELVIIGAYFTDESVDLKTANLWMKSESDTPFFTKALKHLCSTELGKGLLGYFDWDKELKNFYWSLCDIVHVKGMLHSSHKIQPRNFTIGGFCLPEFNDKSLRFAWDSYISSVQFSAMILALTNPILLVGLPIDIKFGMNEPASGFFYKLQAERLNALLPQESKAFFDSVKTEHPTVTGMISFFNSMPDITEDELAQQAAEFKAEFSFN